MPNMFGGDQFHPAYNPSVKETPTTCLVGDNLYTNVGGGFVEVENVSGGIVKISLTSAPAKVREKFSGT